MQSVLIIPIYLVTIISIHDHTCILHMYIYIFIYLFIYLYYIYIHIYIWSPPPTAPRHAVCTVIYNITCSFFMFTFCGYLYMFIRTSSYKQKHNNSLILFGEDPWQRIKKSLNQPKKIWRLFGRKPKKTKNKTKKDKETKPIGDPAIPMVLFFCFFLVFCFFLFFFVFLVFCFFLDFGFV